MSITTVKGFLEVVNQVRESGVPVFLGLPNPRTPGLSIELDQRRNYVFGFSKAVPTISRSEEGDVIVSGANFSGFDFAGADLEGIHFESCDFSGVGFQNALILNCSFAGCSFKGANLTEATLGRNKYYNTDFSGASFVNALITGATDDTPRSPGSPVYKFNVTSFSGADMRGLKFTDYSVSNSTFSEAILAEASLIRVDFSTCNFSNVDLSKSTISTSKLWRSWFAGVNFTDARFVRVYLTEDAEFHRNGVRKSPIAVEGLQVAFDVFGEDTEPSTLIAGLINEMTGNWEEIETPEHDELKSYFRWHEIPDTLKNTNPADVLNQRIPKGLLFKG